MKGNITQMCWDISGQIYNLIEFEIKLLFSSISDFLIILLSQFVSLTQTGTFTFYIFSAQCRMKFMNSVAEFKELERRFKFKPRFKYSWFRLKLYQMFKDLSRRLI